MKQRIIFCIPELLIGGVEIALCELLFALNQLELYEISVITRKLSDDKRFDTFFKNNSDIVLYDMSLKWKRFRFIERPLQKFLIKRKLKEFDVIVDFKYSDFLKFHRKIATLKLCWLHCSFQNLENNIGIDSFVGYDKIICVSKSLAKDIQKHYPELKEKVVPIYNPLNLSLIENMSQERLYTTHKPYFVAVQRLDRIEKDVATIIKAFNLFAKRYSNFYLYIVGSGREYKEYLKGLCESPNIIFTDSLDNSYAIIKSAEALILSSTREVGEGMPVVLQEAHALGTLAISSNVKSGPPEILMDGEAGFLFEQGNHEELANILETVVLDKEICQAKIDCATKNLYRFDAKLVAQEFTKVIESLYLKQSD